MAQRPAILVEGLHKHYGETHALDGLDLVAEEGSILGVLGPNGAGKTTAVRILTTLLKPDSGRVEVAGLDVVKNAAAIRTRIGLAGQYAAVDETLTGYENLKMFGQLYHLSGAVAKQRANELLERFDLAQAAGRPVKTYSGGMRRRLDLAACLIVSPPIIFLDEPTTGLDPRGRLVVWEVIRGLVAEGTTVFLTTQYLEEADQLAHQIAVIDHGRVIAQGTAGDTRGATPRRDCARSRRRRDFPERSGPASPHPGRRLSLAHWPGHHCNRSARRNPGDHLAGKEWTMKNSTLSLTEKVTPQARPALYWLFSDTLVLARRQFMHVLRIPDELVTSSLQPILFVVLFRYIFGGAIAIPGTSYVNYLIAGILVQSVILGSAFTGIGVANDLQRGLVDRFRSLPMAKSAVLTGRTLADLMRSTFIILIVWAVGLLVGFRPEGMILNWIGALGLLLLANFMFSWFSALLGLLLSSVEAVQQSIVVWAFPLQADASTIWQALAWCVGLLVVFIPLSIWAYGRRTTR